MEAVQSFVLNPSQSGTVVRDLFGLIVNELWDLEVTSDTGITAWLEGVEESDDPAVQSLLKLKFTQMLLQQLDEEDDEDDDGDEEEEDGSEEEEND